jgi:hypothetical protein
MLTFPSPPARAGDDYVLHALYGSDIVVVRISVAAISAYGLSACQTTAREKFAAGGMKVGTDVRVVPTDFRPGPSR